MSSLRNEKPRIRNGVDPKGPRVPLVLAITLVCGLALPAFAEPCRDDLGWLCSGSNQIRMTILGAGGEHHNSFSNVLDGSTAPAEPESEGNFARQCSGGVEDLIMGNIQVAGGWIHFGDLSTIPVVLIPDPSGNKTRLCWTGPFDPVGLFRSTDPESLLQGCSQEPHPPNWLATVTGSKCYLDSDVPGVGEVYFYMVLPGD